MTLPNGEPLFKMRVKLAAVNLRMICEDAERGTEFFQINREWACEYLIFGPAAEATPGTEEASSYRSAFAPTLQSPITEDVRLVPARRAD